MISVAIVDDHHAVRLGLHTALSSEPGLSPAGAATNAAELAPLLYRTRPDVILLDYNLPDVDGLTVCRDMKATPLAPGVIVYSAFADGAMTVPAIVAGADGLLDKGVPARELFAAIRQVADGGDAMPPVSPAQLQAAATILEEPDLPILGMLVERTSIPDIADTLRIDQATLKRRIGRMLDALMSSAPPHGAHEKASR
jgi:DNA-binding NarL/FixJ family response regulator